MRTIKKIIKKTIGVLFLVLLIIGGVIGYKGYERYKEVLEKVPLQEKIAEIRQKPSYTEIEDLPQIYLDAVVAVEDKRFTIIRASIRFLSRGRSGMIFGRVR